MTRIRPRLRRFTVVFIMSGLSLLFGTSTRALADAPVATGWWNAALQSNAAVGGVDDPTYHDDGSLIIRNTAAGPAAFAALRYASGAGTSGTLTLTITENRSIETPALVICPTTTAWSVGGDQQWDHRPGYDCGTTKIPGTQNGDHVTWTLGPRLITLSRNFDLVVAPDPGYPRPFEITIAKPDAASFRATGSASHADPDSVDQTSRAVVKEPATSVHAGSTSGFPASSLSVPLVPDQPVVATPITPAPSFETQPQPQARPAAASAKADRHIDGRLLAAIAMLLLSVVVLYRSGRDQRRASPRVGGLGRFVAERTAPPSRL